MIEHRAYEIRIADDPDRRGPGVLHGTLMPFGEMASDRAEMFAPGSLHWEDGGIVLREMHNREAPITRFSPIEAAGEVRVEIPLPDTSRGRDAAIGVRNGTYRGLSVEFQAEQEGRQGNVRLVTRARLTGAGLVDDPAYRGASIEVRGKNDLALLRRAALWL